MSNLADDLSVISLKCLGKLPLPVVQRLAAIAGKLAAKVPSDAKRVTQINIDLCFPDQPPAWRRELVEKSLQETIITAFEMGPVWTGKAEEILGRILSVDGEQRVKDALANGKGVVMLAPHLGNWEVVGYYLSKHYDFGAMYQPGDHPRLSQLILDARQQFKGQLVPTDKTGVMALFKRLKKNKMIGILPDQKPDRTSGVMTPFFGVPALTQTLGPKLASQAKAEVFGGVCFRDRKAGGYRLNFFPVDPDVHHEDLATACAAMNRSIEQWIRLHPEQYQWEYKRFGKRPRDLPDVYKKQSTRK